MNKDEAISRLYAHGNLPGGDENVVGLSRALREWTRHGKNPDLKLLADDIVSCLQVLNADALQGLDGIPFSTPVERGLAYSISCVFSDLAQSLVHSRAMREPNAASEVRQVLAIVTHVWSQFLAGDIADLDRDRQLYNSD